MEYQYQHDNVKNAIKEMINTKIDSIKADYEDEIWGLVENGAIPASPIEKILTAAMFLTPWDYWDTPGRLRYENTSPIRELYGANDEEIGQGCVKRGCLYIIHQHPIGRYKADIAIFAGLKPWGKYIKVAVECDGHDYHEKTKEQASRDKARDRFFQRAGWSILRFTGSDIYKDPMACAEEVSGFVMSLGDRIMRQFPMREERERIY